MVYEQSEIHFAPTHSVEMSIYDPFAGRSRQIYPIADGTAVRRAFVAGVKTRWAAALPGRDLDARLREAAAHPRQLP